MKPLELIERVRAWQPVAYLVARAIVYAVTFVLGLLSAWYGAVPGPTPEWLIRSTAAAAFVSGSLALVNLGRPSED